jgi:hypothetical protein
MACRKHTGLSDSLLIGRCTVRPSLDILTGFFRLVLAVWTLWTAPPAIHTMDKIAGRDPRGTQQSELAQD